jgi:hypothetical protein
MVNILGKSPITGYANRPIGNVGVEYGLRALEAGTISPAQFVDLNATIGSYNDNYQWQPSRAPIASAGLRNAYRSGFMNEADQLNQVAIIDTPKNVQDIHEPYRSFAIRARLDHAFGNHNNDVIWDTTQPTPDAFTVMTQWLSSVANDRRKISLARKIAIDKPPEARDMINIPYNESTREAAGGPLASDILGCTLEPLTRSSFPVSFTHAQWAQLEATFPTGVCNWNAPGTGQQQNLPWLTYAREPGGQPLGAAPQSTIVHAGRR